MEILKILFKKPKEALVLLKILVGSLFSFFCGIIIYGCADGYKVCKEKVERKANDISNYRKRNCKINR